MYLLKTFSDTDVREELPLNREIIKIHTVSRRVAAVAFWKCVFKVPKFSKSSGRTFRFSSNDRLIRVLKKFPSSGVHQRVFFAHLKIAYVMIFVVSKWIFFLNLWSMEAGETL